MSFLSRLLHPWGERPQRVLMDPETVQREELLRERLRERCRRFRSLLSANKAALEAMSEIEEWLGGSHPFGMDDVRAVSVRASTAVFRMVRNLNALADNGFVHLQNVLGTINHSIQALQKAEPHITGSLVCDVANLGVADISLVGAKMANLGEVKNRLGFAVPPGFAITVVAFEAFMAYEGLREELNRCRRGVAYGDMDALAACAATIQERILQAPLPPELEAAIGEAVERLVAEGGAGVTLAVRSSAVGEDSLGCSFAGQYSSKLHVQPNDVCRAYREVVASAYSVRAMRYRYQHGIPDDEAPMGVGVLAMITSKAGGVAYSQDPVQAQWGKHRILLNAVRGLAEGVVDGSQIPFVFALTPADPPMICLRDEGDAPIDESEAKKVAQLAMALERYYGQPQDVEWAFEEGTNKLVVLQTRPLHSEEPEPTEQEVVREEPEPADGGACLAEGGVTVSVGVGWGNVFIARTEADLAAFPKGAILVVERALPRWAAMLTQAAGLISETGGMAGHLATVAREYHVPALFGLANACSVLHNGQEITLDATRRRVVAGRLSLEQKEEKPVPTDLVESPVYKRLKALASLIVPLHLLNPESADFTPEHCQTLHDITRFCHEKAVELLFEADPLSRSMGKQLKAGAKLQYWVIDMGGGFHHAVQGSVVDVKDIASRPMLSLWDGMVAVPWMGPPATSASGFMSVMLQSTMNPELEITAPNAMANKNFFIVSDTYMLLQARYGYHFCTVESLAGKTNHENFVNFQFKGGAADRERRHLRAQMVAELLETYGFRADVREDGLFAVAEDYAAEEILQKTRLLGYLLIHTRQVDMIMLDVERASALRNKLVTDLKTIAARPLPVS
ncbi:MAG: phosphoenolpyruvate synthase [Desulfovibrio sp.]|nr:phosphoenolpyruvate synthase [Desulfovibrio sp.]